MHLPDTFDARNVQPSQGMQGHPAGMFDFQITHTFLKDNSAKTGAMLAVELTSPAGKIENYYNVVNPEPKAVEIANKELSALCHAVNIYQVAYPKNPDGSPVYNMAGHTLRGGRGRMEIGPQMRKTKEGKLEPTGYMEVIKVFDSQGNEPGKGPSAQPQPQQGGGWGNQQQPTQQQAPVQQPQPVNQSWQGGGQQQQQPQQQAWSPGPQQPGQPAAPWTK